MCGGYGDGENGDEKITWSRILNSNWFKFVLRIQKVRYGKKLLMKGIPVVLKRGGNIRIGNNVTIRSGFLSNLIGLYCRTIITSRGPEARIEIGDHVGISGATIYARKGIYIGDNTCIGGNCKILDNDFHPLDALTRNELLSDMERGGDSVLIPTKEIRIGKNCFIGCNAIILKGTILEDGCVVGAGSVVSGKFKENSVIVGNPARTIRYLESAQSENTK